MYSRITGNKRLPTGEEVLTFAGVPPEKIPECLEWAFGKLKDTDPSILMFERWNKLHGDIVKFNPSVIVVSEKKFIKAIWLIGKAYVCDVIEGGDPRSIIIK